MVPNESYEDERVNVCSCGLSVALRERSALCNWSDFIIHTLSIVVNENLIINIDLKIHHYLLSPSITARMAQYWTLLSWQKASPIILSDNVTFDPFRDWDLSEVGTLWQQDESLLWVSSESWCQVVRRMMMMMFWRFKIMAILPEWGGRGREKK